VITTLFTLLLTAAHAEYRAFELVITDSSTGQERVLISTLDPNQYRGYHPVKYTEVVQYRATWMCKGNTAGKPVCAQPEDQPERAPAAVPTPSLDQKTQR